MKLFGKHWYIVASSTKISVEKRKALERGESHIHADPVRKKKDAVQITLPIKEAVNAAN